MFLSPNIQNKTFPNKMHCVRSVPEALKVSKWQGTEEVWLIGGGHVYSEGMQYAEFMDISEGAQTLFI